MGETGQGREADHFVEAATLFLSKRIAGHLQARRVAAAALAAACGGAESTWRSKLNQHRTFQLEDLAKIAATLDPTVFQALQLQVADARDLLPRREHPYLALNEGQLPRLSEHDNLWGGLAQAIDGWLTAEHAAGRSAAVTPDVLSHHVLKEMSGRGAPSAQVLVDRSDNFTILRWPRQSRAVALWWAYPVDAAAASRIAPLMNAVSNTKGILLVAATSQTMKALEEMTGPDEGWSLLSGPQQAESSRSRRPGKRQIRALPGAAAYCKFAEVMVRGN